MQMSETPCPIELELFRHLLVSIAEEMGVVLRRSSYSVNIKERRDYSCAVYDARGETVAMGDHMPVHLGAMPLSVRAAQRSTRSGPGRCRHAERSFPAAERICPISPRSRRSLWTAPRAPPSFLPTARITPMSAA